MDTNVIEFPPVETCACSGGSLGVLQDVQRVYQERMDRLEALPERNRLQMQVSLLRSWVSDLLGQNCLLARAVEDLETEATTRLFLEQRKHNETVCELRAEVSVLRRRAARKDSDVRGLVEVLRRLRELDYCTLDGIHFFDVTESDIFGNDMQHNLAQGDVVTDLKQTREKKANRHRRIL